MGVLEPERYLSYNLCPTCTRELALMTDGVRECTSCGWNEYSAGMIPYTAPYYQKHGCPDCGAPVRICEVCGALRCSKDPTCDAAEDDPDVCGWWLPFGEKLERLIKKAEQEHGTKEGDNAVS